MAMSALLIPCRIMFILEIAQVVPLFSWPYRARFAGVLAVLLDVLPGVDEHAAGARARVVDAHARLRLDEADHHPDDGPRGVELARLLAGGVGELADQVLVGGAEQVGELEVLVPQPVPVEVVDELLELRVRQRGLADLPVKSMCWSTPVRAGALSSSSAPRALLSMSPTRLCARLVLDVLPAGLVRDVEAAAVVEAHVGVLLGGLRGPCPRRPARRSRRSLIASNWSEQRFRNSIPKMYSLKSEASILPRRMSAAPNRCRSSCGSVSLATCVPPHHRCSLETIVTKPDNSTALARIGGHAPFRPPASPGCTLADFR